MQAPYEYGNSNNLGADRPQFCGHCGKEIVQGFAFCTGCGQSTGAVPALPVVQAQVIGVGGLEPTPGASAANGPVEAVIVQEPSPGQGPEPPATLDDPRKAFLKRLLWSRGFVFTSFTMALINFVFCLLLFLPNINPQTVLQAAQAGEQMDFLKYLFTVHFVAEACLRLFVLSIRALRDRMFTFQLALTALMLVETFMIPLLVPSEEGVERGALGYEFSALLIVPTGLRLKRHMRHGEPPNL